MLNILYDLVITPLVYLLEMIFWVMYRIFGGVGVAVIGVSLTVNLLCLPLYRRADAIQTRQREKQKQMEKWTAHIRGAFKGDERLMMQQAYYREQHYSPLSVFKNSISLLLQIPFFTAAYNYLSHLDLFKGASFWFISDLSKPDALITVGALTINLLPVLMTLINFVSSSIYTRGYKFKEKWQLYLIAVIFLVLLYKSPAGLVFYWTLNNLFSLFKNLFMRAVHLTKKQNAVLLCAIGVLVFAFMAIRAPRAQISYLHSYTLGFAAFALLSFPLIKIIFSALKKKTSGKKNEKPGGARGFFAKTLSSCGAGTFVFSAGVLAVLIGAMIPLSVISASPEEFLNLGDAETPFGYILHTLPTATGFFVLWLGVFYLLSNEKVRHLFSFFTLSAAIVSVVNFLFVSRNFGNIDTSLNYAEQFMYTAKEKLINLALIGIIILACALVVRLRASLSKAAALLLLIATVGISAYSAVTVASRISNITPSEDGSFTDGSERILHFSKNGKNVVVFMLDRAMGDYLPYILNEKPELKDKFSGFTYYPNTISHGGATIYGTPELFGGYEYTPVEMERRSDELLVDKHNQALLVMPVLFGENGYDVTVTDPPFVNYSWTNSFSIYEDYDFIDVYGLENGECLNLLSSEDLKLLYGLDRGRSFYYYSLMKSAPLFAGRFIYDGGKYMSLSYNAASHIDKSFLNQYAEIANLEKLTDVQDSFQNNLTVMESSITHTPVTLILPDYTLPVQGAVSAEPDMSLYTINSRTADVYKDAQPYHYHVNMLTMLKLGEWMDYLKEQGVYDNTRIIITADHGRFLSQFKDMIYEGYDLEQFRPLYMVKDFDCDGQIRTDMTFMTIADTPTLAAKDLIENPTNPFTGKEINSDEKTAHDQMITASNKWNPQKGDYTFNLSEYNWFSVHDNVFDLNNWTKIVPQDPDKEE